MQLKPYIDFYSITLQTCIITIRSYRIQLADPEYKQAFEDELVAFKDRIRRRAKEKIQEAIDEEEEEKRKELEAGKSQRIAESPGGLDPIEVLESLPEDLRRYLVYFESKAEIER